MGLKLTHAFILTLAFRFLPLFPYFFSVSPSVPPFLFLSYFIYFYPPSYFPFHLFPLFFFHSYPFLSSIHHFLFSSLPFFSILFFSHLLFPPIISRLLLHSPFPFLPFYFFASPSLLPFPNLFFIPLYPFYLLSTHLFSFLIFDHSSITLHPSFPPCSVHFYIFFLSLPLSSPSHFPFYPPLFPFSIPPHAFTYRHPPI